jgi:hypothetical protein
MIISFRKMLIFDGGQEPEYLPSLSIAFGTPYLSSLVLMTSVSSHMLATLSARFQPKSHFIPVSLNQATDQVWLERATTMRTTTGAV